MRKISKAVLAAGMAAATIASGLSFGAASASAAPTDEIVKSDPFKFVTQIDTNTWAAASGSAGLQNFATKSQAEAFADEFVAIPQGSGYFTIVQSKHLDTCLRSHWNEAAYPFALNYNKDGIRGCVTNPADDALWKQGTDGRIFSEKTIQPDGSFARGTFWLDNVVSKSQYGKFMALTNQASSTGNPWDSIPLNVSRAFRGEVESTDVSNRSAKVSGVALPGSDVLLNGTVEVHADDVTGAWSGTVNGLKLGKNTITAAQYTDDSGEPTGSIMIEAELKIAPLTAAVAWDQKPLQKAVVSGTAQKGAMVIAEDANGKEIGGTRSEDGTYSFTIDAPNAAGDAKITIKQVYDKETYDSKDLTVPYGKAVGITTPTNDADHAGGTLKMTGTGESYAHVEVREKGATRVLAEKDANVGGNWTLEPTLDSGEHTLEVISTGKGKNVTTAEVTINPGKENVENGGFDAAGVGTASTIKQGEKADAHVGMKAGGAVSKMDGTEITLDAPEGTTFTTNQKTLAAESRTSDTGSWTAESGLTATGEVMENGKKFVGKVSNTGSGFKLDKGADVRWKANLTAAKDAPTATEDLEFSISGSTNHGSFDTKGKSPVTIQGAVKPLDITSPRDGSTTQNPTKSVPISGTAEPGARVQILTQGANPRTVIDTWAGSTGNWSAVGDLAFDVDYTLDTVYTAPGEAPVKGLYHVKNVLAGTTIGSNVVTPAENAVVDAPNKEVTISGTATTGTEVKVWNYVSKNRQVAKTVVAGSDGRWSTIASLNNESTPYGLHVEYIKDGVIATQTRNIIVTNSEAVTQPFTVDTPAENSTVVAPDEQVTISGKGTTGTKVDVWNYFTKDRPVAKSVTVDKDGNWSTVATLNNKNTAYALHIEYTAPGAAVQSVTRTITVKAANSTTKPFAITSPVDGGTSSGHTAGQPATITWTGTGTSGATVDIWNEGRTRKVNEKPIVVDAQGNWTGSGNLSVQGYKLLFDYTQDGTVTTTDYTIFVTS